MKVFGPVVVCIVLLFGSWSVMAETIVIVHPSNTAELTAKSVQRIFLGKEKKFSDGSETIPINHEPTSEVRADFDASFLRKSSSQVSAYWAKLVFTGKGVPPKEVANDAEVIDLVSKNPSAIGYIDDASLTDAVKQVSL